LALTLLALTLLALTLLALTLLALTLLALTLLALTLLALTLLALTPLALTLLALTLLALTLLALTLLALTLLALTPLALTLLALTLLALTLLALTLLALTPLALTLLAPTLLALFFWDLFVIILAIPIQILRQGLYILPVFCIHHALNKAHFCILKFNMNIGITNTNTKHQVNTIKKAIIIDFDFGEIAKHTSAHQVITGITISDGNTGVLALNQTINSGVLYGINNILNLICNCWIFINPANSLTNYVTLRSEHSMTNFMAYVHFIKVGVNLSKCRHCQCSGINIERSGLCLYIVLNCKVLAGQ
jgi:hypothetical protein